MSLNKFVKVSSNQGGSFTATNNLVDFDINGGVYDLSSSYVNLVMSVDTTDNGGGNDGVYIPQISILQDDGATSSENNFPNVVLVKNMSLNCANKGQIADIRRVDVLRSNLNQYMLSHDERESLKNESIIQGYSRNHQLNSIFREIRKEGDIISVNKQCGVRIPLSDLCNFGKVKQFDTGKYGKTRLHLELNLDRLSVKQYLGNSDGNNWSRDATAPHNTMKAITVANGADLKTLCTSLVYKNLEDSPFYVGQYIRISGTVEGAYAGGALVNSVKRIEGIVFRRTTATANQGQIELTLNSPLGTTGVPLTGGEGYSAVVVDGANWNSGVVRCDYAELVLEQVSQPQKSSETITYTEFSTEEHNANGTQNFQRQFQIEPECINLFVMKNEDILSKKGDVLSWRLRLNNEDLTNRPVIWNSPLDMDRINMTLGNSNNMLHNSVQRAQEVLEDEIGEDIDISYRREK